MTKQEKMKERQDKSDKEFLKAWDESCKRSAEKRGAAIPDFLKKIVHKKDLVL